MTCRSKVDLKVSILLLCLAIVVSGCTAGEIIDFNNSATLANPDKILAFVGKKKKVVEFDPSVDDPEEVDVILIHMDAAFMARYQVLELIHGVFEGNIVDFEAYDHYGFPKFAKRDVALLYLMERDGRLYHVKYQYDDVYSTDDGRFAGCGDSYSNLEEGEQVDRRALHRIVFEPPVVFQISDFLISEEDRDEYSQDEIETNRLEVNTWFSSPVFRIDGDRAFCQMGVYPDELFRIKNEVLFRPDQRRDMCEQKLGIEGFYANDSADGEAVRNCVAELKLNGLP